MCYDISDAEYPKEWCYGEDGEPTCTKFVKWDWGNDGDPNDPENPKVPVPEDPDQLCFPFIFDEIGANSTVNEFPITKTVNTHGERKTHHIQ